MVFETLCPFLNSMWLRRSLRETASIGFCRCSISKWTELQTTIRNKLRHVQKCGWRRVKSVNQVISSIICHRQNLFGLRNWSVGLCFEELLRRSLRLCIFECYYNLGVINWKSFGRKLSWHNLGTRGISLEGPRSAKKNYNHRIAKLVCHRHRCVRKKYIYLFIFVNVKTWYINIWMEECHGCRCLRRDHWSWDFLWSHGWRQNRFKVVGNTKLWISGWRSVR